MTYNSVAEARTALDSANEKRVQALAEARRLASTSSFGERSEAAFKAYTDAANEWREACFAIKPRVMALMAPYTSAAKARAAMEDFEEKRKKALAECREIAERATAGDEREGDELAYLNALDRYDEAAMSVLAAKRSLDKYSEDAKDAAAWENLGTRLESRTRSMSRTPDTEARWGRPLSRDQHFSDLPGIEAVTLDETASWMKSFLRGESRAMNEAAPGANGGYLVPVAHSANVIQLAREASIVGRLPIEVVPIQSKTQTQPKLATKLAFTARSEADAITETAVTLDLLTYTPRSYSALVKCSTELAADSDLDLLGFLRTEFATSLGELFTTKIVTGSGVAPEVGGLTSMGLTTTHMAAAGASPTSYKEVGQLAGRIDAKGYANQGFLMASRTATDLSLLRDASGASADTGGYLARPSVVSAPFVTTSAVSITETVGASGAVCSSIYAGQWDMLRLGLRGQLELQVLRERFSDTGQIGLIATVRFDVQLARTDAIERLDGIKAVA